MASAAWLLGDAGVLEAERVGEAAESGEVLGHRGRRSTRALERVAVGAHGFSRHVIRRGVGSQDGAEGPVHRGVGAARLGRALVGGDFRRARGEPAGVDEFAEDRRAGVGAVGSSCSPMAGSMASGSDMSGNCPSRTRRAAPFRIPLASGPTVEADGSCPKALVCHGIRVVRGRRWDRDRGSPLVGGLPVLACRRPFSSSSTALPARGRCARATQDSRSFAFNGRWHAGECEAVRPAGRVAICREAGRRATGVRVTPGGVRGRGR